VSVWSIIDTVWSVIDTVWSVIDTVWSIIDTVWSVIDTVWSVIAGHKVESALLMEAASQPTNLLVTFLEYCSVVSQDIRGTLLC